MRIVVAHSQLNTLGGGERVVLELLRHLSERHEVSLWAGRYQPTDTYQELAGFPRRDVAPWQWLYTTPRADVVITHSFGAHLLALRHPGVLCYIHTLRSIYQQRARRPDLWMRRALDRRSVACAAALATNSAYAAAGIQARYHRSAAVVPGGVSSDWFSIAARAGTYALYAGRLAPEKGLERLLAWSAELPLDLAIAGAGDAAYVAYLRAKAGPR
ncbi:MAG TPA: glycosyltransferase, partial [Ktedonobacterales bacterium]|nr:glycosyltransferase [Ktedonobacterales bacterium]